MRADFRFDALLGAPQHDLKNRPYWRTVPDSSPQTHPGRTHVKVTALPPLVQRCRRWHERVAD